MDTRDELLVTLAEFVLDGFAMAHRGPCVNDLVYRTGHLDGLVSCKEKVKALRHKLHEELMSGNTDVMKGCPSHLPCGHHAACADNAVPSACAWCSQLQGFRKALDDHDEANDVLAKKLAVANSVIRNQRRTMAQNVRNRADGSGVSRW